MSTLVIVARPREGKAGTWVATGESCVGVGASADKAIAAAKNSYVSNHKALPEWRGRVKVLEGLLKRPPIRYRATWDEVVVEYSLERE